MNIYPCLMKNILQGVLEKRCQIYLVQSIFVSVADPDPDPVFFGHQDPDPDPGKYRIRILYPQKDPMLFKFSRYKIV